MAKVLGIGGIFFKSPDPAALGDWYARWLGVEMTAHGAHFKPQTMPPESLTVWAPFAADTSYFAPATRDFMLNFVVDDLEAAMRQVIEGGATQIGNIDHYDYGSFGWFIDPDGNKVELWQAPG